MAEIPNPFEVEKAPTSPQERARILHKSFG